MKNTKAELNDKAMEEVIGGQSTDGASGSGFKCPNCGGFIATTIYEIISSDSITCEHCDYVLKIERSKSGSAIDALYKVKKAQENIENKNK